MRAVVVTSIAGAIVAGFVVVLVVRYAARNPDDANLGSREFEVGRADRLAGRISQQREPLLFKDPLTAQPGREVYVQHIGASPDDGWLAIEAYAPGSPREVRCILKWERESRRFRDPCGSKTFARDGEGLVTYPGRVDTRGVVVIDLRRTGGVPK